MFLLIRLPMLVAAEEKDIGKCSGDEVGTGHVPHSVPQISHYLRVYD